MKLNGALKPRQGASTQGSSPGVVLKKYRDKRYYKFNEYVGYVVSLNESGPSYTGPTQNVVKNSKNNKNINRQTQTQSQQIPVQKQQKEVYNKNNNNKNSNNITKSNISSISSLSRNAKSCKIQNYNSTEYRITTATKKSIFSIDFKSKASRSNEIWTIKAATTVKNGEKPTNKNNIITRQVENSNNNNNKINNNVKTNKQQTKKVQVVKATLEVSKHHTTTNKTYNSNNNKSNNKYNNSDLIYSKEQQQQLVVNKFLSIQKIYENLIWCALVFTAAIISRLFKQLKLLLSFMYSHAIKHLTDDYQFDRSGRLDVGFCHAGVRVCSLAVFGCKSIVEMYGSRLAKIMRASQPLKEKQFERICFKNANKSRLNPSIALWMVVCTAFTIFLPQPVVADDGDNFFPINGIETTTPEFDYASRGQKKFGDKCENTLECGFPGSVCDPKKKSCQCTEDLPVTNHIDKCGKEAAVNESCFFNEQCEVKYFQTECRDQRCVCRFDMTPIWLKDGTVECKGRGDKKGPETYIDPAMIGVLVGMALMFVIICVVLRLFSQARWRENRTIFNTPNPRLMNVSLLRESKLLHGQERRGSRMSVRVPSRQPSMASLRPHSPNPSLGKTGSRSNSHGSNASATSLRSTRSNSVSPAGITVNNAHHERKGSTYQPHHHHPSHSVTHAQHQQPQQHEQQQLNTQTNIISNPVAETVTVEIIEPEK